ncbi:MAG: hypothetical protein ACFB2Z_05035 [Maricaulaceae bacterium]
MSTIYRTVVSILGLALCSACATSEGGSDPALNAQPPATAATEPATTEDAPPPKRSDDDYRTRLVCKHEPITGSRFTKRTCLTQAQWDDRRAADREAIRDLERLQSAGGG